MIQFVRILTVNKFETFITLNLFFVLKTFYKKILTYMTFHKQQAYSLFTSMTWCSSFLASLSTLCLLAVYKVRFFTNMSSAVVYIHMFSSLRLCTPSYQHSLYCIAAIVKFELLLLSMPITLLEAYIFIVSSICLVMTV